MNTEKLHIIAHLIVTMAITVLYFFTGKDDPTMQSIMLMIIGYWFGSVPINFKK